MDRCLGSRKRGEPNFRLMQFHGAISTHFNVRRRRSFGHASRIDRFLNEDMANLDPGPGGYWGENLLVGWMDRRGISVPSALRVNDIANLRTRSEYRYF